MRNSQQEIATPEACKGKSAITLTRRLTYIAVLVALSLILKMIGNVLTIVGFRVSFVYIPWILAGALLGPLGGAAVSFITDVLGTFIAGQTPVPLLMLGNALYPIFPALACMLPLKNDYLKIVIGSCFSLLICTLGINTLGLALLYEQSFWFQLVTFRLPQIGVFAVNLTVIGVLYNVVKSRFFGKRRA